MSVSRLGRALVVSLLLSSVAGPLDAQGKPRHLWTSSRPDAQGPVGVSEDRTLGSGQLQVAVEYVHRLLQGQGMGTDTVSTDQVLGSYDTSLDRMLAQGVLLDILVGVSPHLTVVASSAFARRTLDYLARREGRPDVLHPLHAEVSGLQDVRVSALFSVHEQGRVRAHLQGGFSVPVGAIDAAAATAGAGPDPVQLPYPLQMGSGTFDLLPGLTFHMQNEVASLGLQVKGTVRLGENDRGWKLGDAVQADAWAGYRKSRWVSFSLGASYHSWGSVKGTDPALDARESPAHDPLAQGGTRVSLPIGVNLVFPPGRFEGHRFGVDFQLPLHQDLEGPQLRQRWSLVVGWQRAVSF